MFKSTQDKLSDITRTASHATKPFATGRVEVLPVEARPWEEVYLAFKEQYDTALNKLDDAFVRLREIDRKLLSTLPAEVFAQTVRIRRLYGDEVTHYKAVVAGLRRDCESASRNSLAYCFMMAAQRVLTDEQYKICRQSADEIKAWLPSDERLRQQLDPPSIHGRSRGQEYERRKESYQAVLNPNSNRAKRLAQKAKEYGRSGLAPARAKEPGYRIVHKEF